MLERAREIQRRRAAGGEGGFTLIELLIVIIVLGILAAIVVFALGGVTGQSAVAACNSDAKSLSVAVSAFEAQNPNASVITQADLLGTDATYTTPYLKSWPSNASYYAITLSGNAANNVEVTLADKTPGTLWTAGNPATVILASPFTKQYDGNGAYFFPAGAGAGTLPTSALGANICAGV